MTDETKTSEQFRRELEDAAIVNIIAPFWKPFALSPKVHAEDALAALRSAGWDVVRKDDCRAQADALAEAADFVIGCDDEPWIGKDAQRRERNAMDGLRAALSAFRSSPAESGWRPIETAPSAKAVLVFFENALGKGRVIKAIRFEKLQHEESVENDFAEYCEERDAYFTPAGWYEDVHAETGLEYTFHFLDENPTHWRPLPPPPAPAKESGDE